MIAVVVILTLVILVINWHFAQIISQEVEAEIDRQIRADNNIKDITYSNLAVNPLFTSMSFEELSIVEDKFIIAAEDIEFKFGLRDIINLVQDDLNEFEELNKFNLEVKNLNYGFKQEENAIKVSDLEASFNGYFTAEMLDEIEDIFAYDQNLDFSVAEVSFSAADEFEELLFDAETANKLFNIDQLAFKLAYDAQNRTLAIDDSKIDTPIIETESSTKYYFDQDYQFDNLNFDNNLLLKVESKGYLKIDGEDLAWGDPYLTGRYSIDRIKGDSEFDSEIVYDNLITILTSPSQSEAEFLLEGFKVDFAGELREEMQDNPLLFMFGIGLDDFKIEQWRINLKNNLEEVITESEFRTPLLNKGFNFELTIDEQKPEMSKVKDLEVEFSGLHPSLNMILLEIAQPLGISLRQEGGSILFNRQGYLGEIISDFSAEQ